MTATTKIINALLVSVLLIAACGESTPKRNHIPVIKDKVLRLQEAVKAQNRAAIDSLLSPSILEKGQSSDSLLNAVYGPDGSFPFERFSSPSIAYTQSKGRVESYVMDSTGAKDRSIVLFFTYDNDMWLISSFELGADTAMSDSAAG